MIRKLLSATAVLFAAANASHAAGAEFSERFDWREHGFSSQGEMLDYLTIKTIESVPTEALPLSKSDASRLGLLDGLTGGSVGGTISGIIESLSNPSTWVTLGLKAWEIVQAGKPVANVATMRVSVMPVAQTDWAQMENWQGPAAKAFSVTAKNLLGITVVRLDYRVVYNYGGSLGGKGAYLANLAVLPTAIDVLWGFKLNAAVEVENVLNTASKESPVPGIEMQIAYDMDSPLKHSEGRDSFFVKGSGDATHVTAALP